MKTSVSVIIPTYNGAHKILNTLRALEQQSVMDFEVIVAIDGSDDGTQELLERTTFNFNNFKCISQPNKGRAAIRNYGAKKASGDLLIFYDDDIRPVNESVARHVQFHEKNTDSIYSGITPEDRILLTTDIQSYKHVLSQKWTSIYKPGLNKLSIDNLFLTAANLSMPRKLFGDLGGFDERLTDAEDYELAVRAYNRGIPIYFDKSNLAWHDDFITCRGYIQRQRQYNAANSVFNEILPNSFRRKALNIHDLYWPKRWIYSVLSLKIWVKWIDRGVLLWIPIKLRYKIYDLVITSLGKYFPNKPLS